MRHPILYTTAMRLTATLLLAAGLFVPGPGLSAKKLPVALCGRVYLSSGDVIEASGQTRIGSPEKKKKLEIIDDAYTAKGRIGSRLAPEEVDSAVIWAPTAPGRPHTFDFIEGYGWCWRLEHSPHIAVYCFSPKGYHFAGNGGLWVRGKGVMLVVKDGKTYDFGRTDKKMDSGVRRRAAELVADDSALAERMLESSGRRDKVLRKLVLYNPDR